MKKVFLLLWGVSLIFISCHSKFINIGVRDTNGVAFSSDSSSAVFIESIVISRRPVGLAKFPDGGTSTFEYIDLALYHYNFTDTVLRRLVDLSDLISLYGNYNAPEADVCYRDSFVYYYLKPPSETTVKFLLKHAKDDAEAAEIEERLQKVGRYYKYDMNTGENSQTDISEWPCPEKDYHEKVASRKELFRMLSIDSFANMIFDLREIYPQSDKTYMDYIIYAKGNSLTRRLIVKQILPGFSSRKLKYILRKMAKEKQRLKNDYKGNNYNKHLAMERYNKYFAEMYPLVEKIEERSLK